MTAYLAGDFQAEQWRDFQTKDALLGWAYFALLQGTAWREIVREYRLSNKELAFVKSVLTAYEALKDGWTNRHYFIYTEQQLEAAQYFAQLRQLNVSIPQQSIQELQAKLPIKHKQELVVNGADLLKWSGKKGGPWVKAALEDMLTAILHQELQNDRQQIKSWLEQHNLT